jgi:divalent metal cation (Fe/Co/Zn/Cd) transporter
VDACASLAVMGSVIAAQRGCLYFDFLAAVIQAAHVVWCACLFLDDAIKGLMDASIDARQLAQIERSLRGTEGVLDVSSLKAVKSGQQISISVVLVLPYNLSIAEAGILRERVIAALRQKVAHVGEVLVGFQAMMTKAAGLPAKKQEIGP